MMEKKMETTMVLLGLGIRESLSKFQPLSANLG